MKKKVLLIGWDAADWKLIQPLVDTGLMPTTKRLMEGGVMADLLTLSPILSPVLWTTIATGKRPHKHGILGFTEAMPSGVGVRPITNLSRKTKAIWNILSQKNMTSNVVGWWPSNPAEPINGVMVSNLYQKAIGPADKGWPLKAGTVHPPELATELAELRVHPEDITPEEIRLFVPEGQRIDQDKDSRLASVVKILAECASIQACAIHLMERTTWDFMAVYFDGIDHFCHGFMRYHPPRLGWVSEEDYEIYKNVVAAGYVFHDLMLGHMLESAGEDTTVVVVSDHGFHPDHMRRKQLPNEPAGPATEHREHGMFLIHGPGIRRDELIHGVSLLDVTPTVLSLFGLPVGEDMDGRALLEIYDKPVAADSIPSWDEIAGDAGLHPDDMAPDVDDSEEAMEQLVALGYIDRPSGDGREAAARATMENEYNLARSYMHAGMHGEAVSILATLYTHNPLEFRFGIQLAICLQALEHVDDLAELVTDLRQRWQSAAKASRERLAEVAEIAKERKALLKKIQEQRAQQVETADGEPRPTPIERVFSAQEQDVIKKLRSIARGNVNALDYMDGWVAMARGDHERALALFGQAENPEAAGTGYHYQMGEAYRNLRRKKEALASYRRVLELDPHDAAAYLGLARVHVRTLDYTAAEEMARTALALKYHLPPAHYILALCLAKKEDFREAIDSLNVALKQNPNYADAHERLAQIWGENLGDHDQAAAHLEMAEAIREQGRSQQPQSLIADLPRFSEIDYPQRLPVFPQSEIVPRLGDDITTTVGADDAAGSETIYVVSGLPRSGTSMLMQMLVAAGIPPLTDEQRQADESNPRGYFELDKVKRLRQANDWLAEARGKCLKGVSPLLPYLPQGEDYRVILIERDLEEVSASQRNMLERLNQSGGALTDAALKDFLAEQNAFARKRLEAHSVAYLDVSHAETIADPASAAKRIAEFLDVTNQERIATMTAIVDAELHRERAGDRDIDAA